VRTKLSAPFMFVLSRPNEMKGESIALTVYPIRVTIGVEQLTIRGGRMRRWISSVIAIAAAVASGVAHSATAKYIRYESQGKTSYGILDGDTVRELSAAPWTTGKATGKTAKLSNVRLLAPAEPTKVVCAGLNYKSHIGQQQPAKYVGLFSKPPSAIVAHEANIVYPTDASNLHFEGELVIVIGKTASKVKREQALDYVFGVTIGNDVSERAWQRDDLQWYRAKGADTFGPLGPWIVTGINYQDVLLETRVNGKTLQSQRTKDLIFDIPYLVSYVSQYVTLVPGDVIYTGTPGTTSAMQPGDVVEVEIEGIGVLRNKVVKASTPAYLPPLE
jgi:2-keto-4-pentenoate hydratase/2-oxohepta-3-ene-1,7-dioic acid hydratase in catechol pathway